MTRTVIIRQGRYGGEYHGHTSRDTDRDSRAESGDLPGSGRISSGSFNGQTSSTWTLDLGGIRKEYAGAFADQQIGSAKADLSLRMVEDCPMKTTCYGAFTEFLENSARDIAEGTVSEELIQSYREKMAALRKKGRKEECSTCFTELAGSLRTRSG